MHAHAGVGMSGKNIVINIVVDRDTFDGILELQAALGLNRSAVVRKLVQREREIIQHNAAVSRPVQAPDIEQFFREMHER